jgi:hypothetical protein
MNGSSLSFVKYWSASAYVLDHSFLPRSLEGTSHFLSSLVSMIHGAWERLASQDHFYPQSGSASPQIALMMYVMATMNIMIVIGRPRRCRPSVSDRRNAVGFPRREQWKVCMSGKAFVLVVRGALEKSPRQRQAHGVGQSAYLRHTKCYICLLSCKSVDPRWPAPRNVSNQLILLLRRGAERLFCFVFLAFL